MTMKNQINSLNAQISNLNNQLVAKENIIENQKKSIIKLQNEVNNKIIKCK